MCRMMKNNISHMPIKCHMRTVSELGTSTKTQPNILSAQLSAPKPWLYSAKPVHTMNRATTTLKSHMAICASGLCPTLLAVFRVANA